MIDRQERPNMHLDHARALRLPVRSSAAPLYNYARSERRMPNLPEPQIFYVSVPLYEKFKLNKINYGDLLRLHFFKGPLDAYCPDCGRESVYSGTRELPGAVPQINREAVSPQSVEELLEHEMVMLSEDGRTYNFVNLRDYALADKTIVNRFICSRDASHHFEFVLKTKDGILQKVGQWPSLADLQRNDIKKYQKILGPEKSSEFTKAIGLSAHGVGIGSFVYLRRIFEDLIESARKEASQKTGWSDENFYKSRMDEKILLLKDYLPTFLVENRVIYSILSIGVHGLTEQQCLENFEPVKLAIEIILDEKIEKLLKEEKQAAASKALSAIKSQISG